MMFGRHLIYRLGLAAGQGVIIVAAMVDRHVGIGALIWIGTVAIISAFRDHRRQRRRAAESAELDLRLSAALSWFRRSAAQGCSDAVEEQRWS